jgi:hypothetical protein
MQESQSLLSFLTLALGEGIITIFMPCIYPIMPMTVSFFLKQKDGKLAFTPATTAERDALWTQLSGLPVPEPTPSKYGTPPPFPKFPTPSPEPPPSANTSTVPGLFNKPPPNPATRTAPAPIRP